MSEVKFHTKPTQVNRKNPILIVDRLPVVQTWMYELDNGYFVLFAVYDGHRSEANLAAFDDNGHVYYLDFTKIDIHTRQDLVEFVKNYNKMTTLDIFKMYKQGIALTGIKDGL